MNERFRIFFYYGYKVGLHVFALAGFFLIVGFFAVRLHWTDVEGTIDANSERFQQPLLGKEVKADTRVLGAADQRKATSQNSLNGLDLQIKKLSAKRDLKQKNYCAVDVIGRYAPGAAAKIIATYQQTDSDVLALKMILAARLRIEEKNGNGLFTDCDSGSFIIDDEVVDNKYIGAESKTIFPWMDNEQWETIREAIVKDWDVIERAANIADIEPRLLVSCAIVEQVRLFNSDRELFKKFFEPLKILGNANKISLGIMGIKENTAVDTEIHLKDLNSPYYLGADFEGVLDFENGSDGNKRYDRLTEDTHYYSYLYGAIYLKQMMSQWEKAGYDIELRPEIVGTLFNVGFPQSKPNPNPKVGGSEISVGDTKYSFGSLAYEFYYSGELVNVFPYVTK